MVKKVSFEIEDNVLELIDRAAKEEFCSRTSFLVRNAVKAARELVGEQ